MKLHNEIYKRFVFGGFLLHVCALGVVGAAYAQGQTLNQQGAAQNQEAAEQEQDTEVLPSEIDTIFFLDNEYAALLDARQIGKRATPLTADEMEKYLPDEPKDDPLNVERPKPPPEKRELRLGGILFVDNDDWTIWFNDQRVTPTAIPTEIINLQVSRDYIEFRWLDDWSGQIFPIRLRPHQRFNMDSRIFLPGSRDG